MFSLEEEKISVNFSSIQIKQDNFTNIFTSNNECLEIMNLLQSYLHFIEAPQRKITNLLYNKSAEPRETLLQYMVKFYKDKNCYTMIFSITQKTIDIKIEGNIDRYKLIKDIYNYLKKNLQKM